MLSKSSRRLTTDRRADKCSERCSGTTSSCSGSHKASVRVHRMNSFAVWIPLRQASCECLVIHWRDWMSQADLQRSCSSWGRYAGCPLAVTLSRCTGVRAYCSLAFVIRGVSTSMGRPSASPLCPIHLGRVQTFPPEDTWK